MNWQDRAKAATKGSQLGAMLRAALGETIPAPCFTGKAVITSDAFVMCNFLGSDGRAHHGAFVGSARDLARNISGLAAHLKLTDEEKKEMLTTFREWIATDYSNGAWLT
jgi:hypothetical protein